MILSTARSAEWHDRPWFGIALFIASLALMAILGAMVKSLSDKYPLTEILSLRFAIAALIFVLVLPSAGGFNSLKTQRPIEHVIRTVSGFTGLGLFYFAIATIPIADATALAYSAPIFIVVFSIPLLGEQIGSVRWAAVLLGFVGVLLIAQPTNSSISLGTLAGVGSAITGALVSISLRRLSKTEKTTTIGFYYNLSGALFYTAWAAATGWVVPSGSDAGLLLVFGVIAGLQQWSLTHSARYAEASLLAPFQYLILVFAALLGYFVWGEVPTLTTWLGAAIITASGLFTIFRKRHVDQDKTR